jgi:hypothetical protein
VIVETTDHVGRAAQHGFERFRASRKIDQRDSYAGVAIVAEFVRPSVAAR